MKNRHMSTKAWAKSLPKLVSGLHKNTYVLVQHPMKLAFPKNFSLLGLKMACANAGMSSKEL